MASEIVSIANLARQFGLEVRPVSNSRGAKQNPYSQDKLILQVLKRGGSFNESELGKIIYGKDYVGARALIHVLREKGHPIAHHVKRDPFTNRNRKYYYYENNRYTYYEWAMKNGYFTFKKGAPK
jgi:hypothetical protein